MSGTHARKRERGVSILLVAVCLAALLAMAALAIDVVTLYVARTEAQRASDAAALAGARMLAASGYTSSSSSWNQTDLCVGGGPGAAAAANAQAEAVAAQNHVAGRAAVVKTIACNWGPQDATNGNFTNPQITVTVQRLNLPTFFARIWGRTASSVTATSTAEAYNPSGSATPIQVSGVKPWLVPNCDPTNVGPANPACTAGAFFVNPASGSIENVGAQSPIGKTIALAHVTGCSNGASPKPTGSLGPPPCLDYYRINIPINPPQPLCPSTNGSCGQVGSDDFLDNIACTSAYQFACGQTIGAGTNVTVLSTGNYGVKTNEGTRCLIHAGGAGLGQGQDVLTPSGGSVVEIDGGDNNPNPALQVQNISRSDSVVTVPIYQGGTNGDLCPGGACTQTGTIVGFLQLGITQNLRRTDPPNPPNANGKIQAVILNVAGCNSSGGGTPVSGGGISAIPVRLVHQ